MKKSCGIHAEDDLATIDVAVRISIKGPLTADEADKVRRTAAREIAAALTRLPFTDFGAENTRVVLGAR